MWMATHRTVHLEVLPIPIQPPRFHGLKISRRKDFGEPDGLPVPEIAGPDIAEGAYQFESDINRMHLGLIMVRCILFCSSLA